MLDILTAESVEANPEFAEERQWKNQGNARDARCTRAADYVSYVLYKRLHFSNRVLTVSAVMNVPILRSTSFKQTRKLLSSKGTGLIPRIYQSDVEPYTILATARIEAGGNSIVNDLLKLQVLHAPGEVLSPSIAP